MEERMKMFRAITLTGAVLLGLVLPTLADAAYTCRWAYVRSGPGINHPVLALAWPGVPFTVQSCSRHWCKVNYVGIRGWMWANFVKGR
jgi:uncharacterized protein YraI